jgi:gamma-glutamyltranspeptidase
MLVLNIIERYNLPLLFAQDKEPMAYHWLVEALKFAFSDRMALVR